ncbi:alpha-1,2-fucosyltransferase [uncultured Microbacterium sp.]|uniref:alpha-1,2-fucosyltransferase n=1 Tax=uncultured Microbacterium sp. TaxID=191216 RepID=UPI0026399580|nr:alpha-1,2-fucosyltransferase [uncultured Microbacterium sp.]
MFVPLGRLAGAPCVQLTSPLTRAGNHLYDWMWAFRHDRPRRPARVQHQPSMVPWLAEFPLLDALTLPLATTPRLFADFRGSHEDIFGQHFTRAELARFCTALVASSSSFRTRLSRAADDVGHRSVVVNVRRGDYYEHDFLQAAYGLDIEGYVGASLRALRAQGVPADEIVIVSDDLDWCLQHLPAVVDLPLRPLAQRSSPLDDLAALAAARTVILANSTFSFWGAHIGAALHPDTLVLAPPYHFIDDGVPDKKRFDPTWQVITP